MSFTNILSSKFFIVIFYPLLIFVQDPIGGNTPTDYTKKAEERN